MTFTAASIVLPLLATTLFVDVTVQAAPPVHAVRGIGVFFLETGARNGGSLILHYSINASLDQDGSAYGRITSTINSITLSAAGGYPDPFGKLRATHNANWPGNGMRPILLVAGGGAGGATAAWDK